MESDWRSKRSATGSGARSTGKQTESMQHRKKLIEVALPLDAINMASAREKSIRHGHPSTLHLWWARRPLAAARAVIFAQMVDDPSAYVDVLRADPKLVERRSRAQGPLKLGKRRGALAEQAKEHEAIRPGNPVRKPTLDECCSEKERQRLFRIIEDLVLWENTTNETVLQAARDEIWQSWRRACAENADHPRAKELFDRQQAARLPRSLRRRRGAAAGGAAARARELRQRPEPGGGADQQGDDRDPAEVRGQAAGEPGVARRREALISTEWKGAQGLAEDVRYYGQWMRDEAEKRIGHLYPKVEITAEMAKERPDLKPYRGPETHCDRLALGAHGEEPEPGLREGGRAARLDLHALHQGGQGGLRRAGDRGRRLPLHGEGGQAEGCRGGEERHQARARCELSSA